MHISVSFVLSVCHVDIVLIHTFTPEPTLLLAACFIVTCSSYRICSYQYVAFQSMGTVHAVYGIKKRMVLFYWLHLKFPSKFCQLAQEYTVGV